MRQVGIVTAAALLLGSALPADAQTNSFLGRSSTEWIRELRSPRPAERRSAAFALGRLGLAGWDGVMLLKERLEKDDDASVREMAASAMGDINAAKRTIDHQVLPPAFIEALCKALDSDESPRVRRSAAYALGCFGRQGSAGEDTLRKAFAAATDSLRKALASPEAQVRQNAVWALGQLADLGQDDLNALTDRLTDSDALVRRDTVSALKEIGNKEVGVVKPMLAMVTVEKDDVVRRTALDALAGLAGPKHRDLPTDGFEKLLLDSNPDTQRAAAIVLARIGGPKARAAVTALKKALTDSDPQIQTLAAAALGSLGPEAAPAVPDLARALKESPNNQTRHYCAIALGLIGPDAKPAVPALAAALTDKEILVRRQAAEALGQIHYPTNEAAVPAILQAIQKDRDALTRQRCVWALFNFNFRDNDRDNARAILTGVLEERDSDQTLVRYDVARLVANVLRAEAPDRTVDVLLDMLENKTLKVFFKTDPTVSGTATERDKGKAGSQADLGGDARFMAAEALGWLDTKVKNNKTVIDALRKASKDDDKELREKATASMKMLGIP
jgi:HEAT repeat protein